MNMTRPLKWLLTGLLGLFSNVLATNTYGALPTSYGGATAPTNGNWFQLISNYISEGGDVMGLGLTMISFIIAAYFVIAKVNEARSGQAEWVEVAVTSAVSVAAVMLIAFFADQAQLVI